MASPPPFSCPLPPLSAAHLPFLSRYVSCRVPFLPLLPLPPPAKDSSPCNPKRRPFTAAGPFHAQGAGLANLGNTCFLNSVLQCLTYTPPLAAVLQAAAHRPACQAAGFCTFCALEAHVGAVLRSPGRVVAPTALVRNLRTIDAMMVSASLTLDMAGLGISRAFRPGRQEDAHEFVRHLLEALHRACLPPAIARNPAAAAASTATLVHRIFGGRLRSQVRCTACGHCSNTYDPFLDLSLEVSRADSVDKALRRFTATEVLDGSNKYKCASCGRRVCAEKQLTIERAPAVLALQLKRFDHQGSHSGKIDKLVHFGTGLDLAPFLSSREQAGQVRYELYAVLVHAGWSTHSGHYYCFACTASGIWHALDDTRVRQVSQKTVLEQKAYLLFYLRTAAKPPSPAVAMSSPSATLRPPVAVDLAKERQSQQPAEASQRSAPPDGTRRPHHPAVLSSVPGLPSEDAQLQRPSAVPPAVEAQASTYASRSIGVGGDTEDVGVPIARATAPNDRGKDAGSGHDSVRAEAGGQRSSSASKRSVSEGEAGPAAVDGGGGDGGGGGGWDHYYKRPFHIPAAYARLLRVMPSTRRYFWAARYTKKKATTSSGADEDSSSKGGSKIAGPAGLPTDDEVGRLALVPAATTDGAAAVAQLHVIGPQSRPGEAPRASQGGSDVHDDEGDDGRRMPGSRKNRGKLKDSTVKEGSATDTSRPAAAARVEVPGRAAGAAGASARGESEGAAQDALRGPAVQAMLKAAKIGLYGSDVRGWGAEKDARGQTQEQGLVNGARRPPAVTAAHRRPRYDSWDQEYDRGRAKKVRKRGSGAAMAGGENPFLVAAKQRSRS
eukprot:SM000132S26911  [mRNA]  locus=s132:391505:395716:- [translate_table: standard]